MGKTLASTQTEYLSVFCSALQRLMSDSSLTSFNGDVMAVDGYRYLPLPDYQGIVNLIYIASEFFFFYL